ncbi:MAG: hypothetical protein ACLRQR_05030 [Merdimonas faecis]|uniref:hypothetical protein n=1 Tax=Merdimonas faecis TaxID=1653435 RepID=UPI00399085AE
MMKRIAILGDPNSIWIKTYVREILDNPYIENITILTDRHYKDNTNFCYPGNVDIIVCEGGKIVYLIKMFLAFWKLAKLDVIHIHYVNMRKLIVVSCVRRKANQIIATFWGSDLLSKSETELHNMERYLKNVHKITVGSNEMSTFFKRKFSNSTCNKMQVVRFGVNGLETIYKKKFNSDSLKTIWRIPHDKMILTIGYNGSERQNHSKVIDTITRLSSLAKTRLFLLFPMTYGATEQYLNKVNDLAEKTGVEYKILTEYMNSDEIAELCYLTDVFIHAQETDAFSASVQEYLCAGKLLINPQWIIYDELRVNNVFYWEYQSFNELYEKIEKLAIYGITDFEKSLLMENKGKIYGLSSWDHLKKNWIEMYEA